MAKKVTDLGDKFLLAGLGVITITKEKAEKFVKELVSRGEVTKKGSSTLINDLLNKGKRARKEIKDFIKKETTLIYKQANRASQKEVNELKKRIRQLEARLKQK